MAVVVRQQMRGRRLSRRAAEGVEDIWRLGRQTRKKGTGSRSLFSAYSSACGLCGLCVGWVVGEGLLVDASMATCGHAALLGYTNGVLLLWLRKRRPLHSLYVDVVAG